MIVRILLWSLGDAKTSLAEVRDHLDVLDELEPPSVWLVNDVTERFGAVLALQDADELPHQLAVVRRLIGKDPEVFEDFDALA